MLPPPMATESTPPPASSGNVKYGIIGLLLIAAAAGIWFAMKLGKDDGEVAQALPDAGVIERTTAIAEPDLLIPDPEPDAGPQIDAGPPRKRIVYRYVRGDWECSGEIPATAAQAVINENRRQVRNCYERQLKTNHQLQGTLSLHLRVGQNGQVTGAQVGGSLRDPAVFSCVRNLAQSWRFPAPTGGNCAVISAPFNLTPRE